MFSRMPNPSHLLLKLDLKGLMIEFFDFGNGFKD